MFEQDHSESPAAPEKKVSTMVLLAAGGVLVATICATLASMLATGASKPEAGPPKAKAEVEVETDQPAITSTSVSIAPDGSTSTVIITVPAKTRPEEHAQNAANPAEPSAAEVVVTQTETSVAATTKRPTFNPPTSSSSSTTTSSEPAETSSAAPSVSGAPEKP